MIRTTLRLARFRRADRGTATVEFCILFPVFMVMLLSGFEAGMLMTRQLMLERGLDMTMRQLRLGLMAEPNHTKVKTEICRNALIIPNCMTMVMLEMSEVDTVAWNVPLDGNHCIEKKEDMNPADEPGGFATGARNTLMMVRACAVFDPWFPGVGLGAQLPIDPKSGGYRLMATSGFMNEP